MVTRIRSVDPTNTQAERRKFLRAVRARVRRIKKQVTDLIVKEDAFGLKQVRNTRWAFRTDADKATEFGKWLATLMAVEFETDKVAEDAFWYEYIRTGYGKGAGKVLKEFFARRDDLSQVLSPFDLTRGNVFTTSFGTPVSIDKVKLLAGRTLTDLKGVTEVVATQVQRELVDGLIQGDNPRVIARKINKKIDTIGKRRAETIARTEIIRTHAEGQLDTMEELDIPAVTAAVEWSTALDNRVCPLCQPLEGIVLKIPEARGLLPRHPNCRCAWRPANVGEKQDKQKRSREQIERALKKSKKLEGKKSTFGTKLSKKRPKDSLKS